MRLAIGVVEQVWCASVPSHNDLAMTRLGTCVVSRSHTPLCYSMGGSGQLTASHFSNLHPLQNWTYTQSFLYLNAMLKFVLSLRGRLLCKRGPTQLANLSSTKR